MEDLVSSERLRKLIKAVQLLAPISRRVLNKMNTNLLLGTGQLTESAYDARRMEE
jgi:hypothetical protein